MLTAPAPHPASWRRRRVPQPFLLPGLILGVAITLLVGSTAIAAPPIEALPSSTPAGAKELDEVAGTVTDPSGSPIPRAWVTDGTSYAFTDDDGSFVFPASTAPLGASMTISAAGYAPLTMATPSRGTIEATLQPATIRAIYFNPVISNTPEPVNSFINIAETTEVNAVVIDIKEEYVYYNTDVPLFATSGGLNPIMDLRALVRQFHEHDIYVIARLAVFKDSFVATAHPDTALRNGVTGLPWRDAIGAAWIDPTNRQVQDATIDLAVEAAGLGVDEMQFDYVRFPTDGNLAAIAWPYALTEDLREQTIGGFLQRAHEALLLTGTPLSADVFGYTTVVNDDLGIGQNLDQIADVVDVMSPMVYPSHWPYGSLNLPGDPNDYPYDTVQRSLAAGIGQIGDARRRQFRPWLQDFSLPGERTYGDADVRAQIQAVDDLGLGGWMLWSPSNVYNTGALQPETADRVPAGLPSADRPLPGHARRTWLAARWKPFRPVYH